MLEIQGLSCKQVLTLVIISKGAYISGLQETQKPVEKSYCMASLWSTQCNIIQCAAITTLASVTVSEQNCLKYLSCLDSPCFIKMIAEGFAYR